jgi:integrase
VTGSTRTAVTDKTLKAWLSAGSVDRGVGDGLTFQASEAGAREGKASWILRYRHHGRHREKVLGRYPELSLKDARELARLDRSLVQQGEDVAAKKQLAKVQVVEAEDVSALWRLWYERHVRHKLKFPEAVVRVMQRHVDPVIGKLRVPDVRPAHIDLVLTKIVAAGAPTVANNALSFLFRAFHFAVRRQWIEVNPVYGFNIQDAGGTEAPRDRWLTHDELCGLALEMRRSPTFGRINELSVWLLLALCVRKMELLSARRQDFDLEARVWRLASSKTKTGVGTVIPLSPHVVEWLNEVIVFSCGSEYLFPARRLIRMRKGLPRQNLFPHVSPSTLNEALRHLALEEIAHFTVHDMRRTARTHLAALGVDRFVAERALNHKIPGVEGTYNRYDYLDERRFALGQWSAVLWRISQGERPLEPDQVIKERRQSDGRPPSLCTPLDPGPRRVADWHGSK